MRRRKKGLKPVNNWELGEAQTFRMGKPQIYVVQNKLAISKDRQRKPKDSKWRIKPLL